VAATMKSNPHLLGTILERSGKASPADLARATAMQRAGDKRRVGEILVAHGIVTPRDIDRFMRLQIETVVFDLMSWSEGFFSFSEEPPRPMRKDIAVRVSTESLLMEGARRIDEWSRMADKIPDARVMPRLAPLDEGPESFIDLLPREWEVLSVIDG
jgi:diaminopimelate decarboxylase